MDRFFQNRTAGLVCAACLSSVAAYAHGPQIQTGIENSQIVMRELFSNEPYDGSVTPIQRVYEIPMSQRSLGDANDGWYAQPNASFPYTGPGIATALGGFGTGSVLSLTFADGLKWWDGAGFADPGTEQIDAYQGSNHTTGAMTSDTGPFDLFSFTTLTNTGDEHRTAYFRLLGDGVVPDSPSDDGIYLLTLQLLSDESGIAPSLPYYFLLDKNSSPGDSEAALNYVNTNIAPEPGTLTFLAATGCCLFLRRRLARSHAVLRCPGGGRNRLWRLWNLN